MKTNMWKAVSLKTKKAVKHFPIRLAPSEIITVVVFLLISAFTIITLQIINQNLKQNSKKANAIVYVPLPSFIASIDTVGESYNMEGDPLSLADIQKHVKLAATLNTNYITVDTDWDYGDYMQEWINEIRKTGKHVWFRGHPVQWVTGANGVMTPTQYIDYEKDFITQHPGLFKTGDIFESCAEPEAGKYWANVYGNTWIANAPNDATKELNTFIRDSVDAADVSFQTAGINGVITTVYSMNSSFILAPGALETATTAKLGAITVDSFPEGNTTNPKTAADERTNELSKIYSEQNVPIILGKMGYSNTVNVDDATQRDVLETEFAALAKLKFIKGLNYWVSVGTNRTGYSYIFKNNANNWILRPAAIALQSFFGSKNNTGTIQAVSTVQTTPATSSSNLTK